jgi:hypothetical protein
MIGIGIDVRIFHNFGSQLARTGNGGIEIVDLKPQQHAVPPRLDVRAAHVTMLIVFDVPGVQL